jgi:phosphoglycolate phosphatase
MPQLLGLIFDLEGTLVDSAADMKQTLNALMAAHGRRALSLDEAKGMIGDGLNALLNRAFAATGEPLSERAAQTAYQDFMTLYKTQKASPEQLYPHVRETLASFHGQHIKIGLCTNKPYLPTLKLLEDIGIADFFDFVAGYDTFPVCKPHPGHVLGVIKGLGLLPINCAMIGDSLNDIHAARGAGIVSIAVAHGYGEDAGTLGADAVISGFTELPQALRSLGFDFLG